MIGADDVASIGRREREKFERDGHLILDDSGCSESVLDGIVADLDGRFAEEYRREYDGVYYSNHRIILVARALPGIRAAPGKPPSDGCAR